MYPRDAITISFTTKTAGTYTLIPSSTTPYTILSGSMSGTGAGGDEQAFVLGTSTIWLKGDVAQQLSLHLVYVNVPLKVVKVGNASTTFGVTYVPRNRNKTNDPVLSSTTVDISSTSISVLPTSQEITTIDYIYLIIVTVGLLLYIFKK